MKQFLRDYFTFNRRERNGVFILLSVIMLLILCLSFADYFFTGGKINFSQFEKEIALFEAEQKRLEDSFALEKKNYFASSNAPDADSAERFYFNPNNLSEEDWKRLGLSGKQIRVLKNYENKGGKFRTKEDVKKMYCISAELYASLEPWIRIGEEKNTSYFKTERQADKFQTDLIELNTADTTELKKLKGIGSAFAKRIVKFRDALGGFSKKEQLLEVYGLDKEKYDLISSKVKAEQSMVKKININSASADEMKKHPYIKWKLAQEIISYRNKNKKFSDLQELKKIILVDAELFTKLEPYLTSE